MIAETINYAGQAPVQGVYPLACVAALGRGRERERKGEGGEEGEVGEGEGLRRLFIHR